MSLDSVTHVSGISVTYVLGCSDKVAEKGREHRHEKAQETHGMVERQSGEESERLAVVDVGEDTQKESGGDHGQVSCLWKIGE